MKKNIKRLTVTAVTLLALIGAGGITAFAAGYIQWGGTQDYHLTLDHLDGLESGIGNLKTDKQDLIIERDNLITEYERVVAQGENTHRENEQLNNRVLDLQNQINSLEQDIIALERRIADGQTTRGQLEQAEKDMSHVEERTKEVLEGLE